MKLLTVNEVAGQLSVSLATVYKLAENGKLECIKIGSCLRFTQEQIDSHIFDCTITRGQK